MAYLNDGAIYEELMLEDPRDPNEHSSDEDDVVITDNVQEDLNSVHSDTELQDDLQNSELISEEETPPEKQPRHSDPSSKPSSSTACHVLVPSRTSVKGKNGYRWSTVAPVKFGRTPKRNIVVSIPGPKGNAKHVKTPLSSFLLFLDNDILETIIQCTNEEIERQRLNYSDDQRNLGIITYDELLALLGLYIYFGAHKSSQVSTELLWHKMRGLRITETVMSQRRFRFLTNCLRFDEKSTRSERKQLDSFAAIRDVWNRFEEKCRMLYNPGSYCTIDEQLLAFRGKCPFRMYIPNKPAKYGIKTVMCCDAKTGYMLTAIPYTGKTMNTNGKPLAEFFVEELSKPIHGTNRNITVDNWFSSIPLFKAMAQRKLTMVGTLRKNKPQIPKEMIDIRERNENTSMFAFDNELVLLSYVPKKGKYVLLLSNMHQGASVSESGLPEIIEFYNSTKGGVDMFDQMCSTYSCNRKTQRWPLCVFYGIINSSCLNAYVILRHNMTTVGAHVQPREMFLLSLGEAMMTPWMEKRLVMQNLPRLIRENIADQLGKNVPETSTTLQGEGAKRRCHLCPRSKDRKSKIQCSECKRTVCQDHKVSLCLQCKR
ncbi:piggyBac transposable element-derived protein 4-like [Periplaneta americana]|uniref:piggyBac transposable element-derived protein 4-like n=1 Tax=Periplaneta americana TaxID=6978 RepID=UPI0037E81964